MNDLSITKHKSPLSKFQTDATSLIQFVRQSKRSIVITQNGEDAAVLLGVDQYEAIIKELELLRDIDEGIEQYHKGNYISHEDAKKQIVSRM